LEAIDENAKMQIEKAQAIVGKMKEIARKAKLPEETLKKLDPANLAEMSINVGDPTEPLKQAGQSIVEGGQSALDDAGGIVDDFVPDDLNPFDSPLIQSASKLQSASNTITLFDTGLRTAIVTVPASTTDESGAGEEDDQKGEIKFDPPFEFKIDVLNLDAILDDLRKAGLPADFKIPDTIAFGGLKADFFTDRLKVFVARKTDKSDYERRKQEFIQANGGQAQNCYFARQKEVFD
jgi:hypothetical protein